MLKALLPHDIPSAEHVVSRKSPSLRLHPNATNPYEWPGLNLVGFALMEVRQTIQDATQNNE